MPQAHYGLGHHSAARAQAYSYQTGTGLHSRDGRSGRRRTPTPTNRRPVGDRLYEKALEKRQRHELIVCAAEAEAKKMSRAPQISKESQRLARVRKLRNVQQAWVKYTTKQFDELARKHHPVRSTPCQRVSIQDPLRGPSPQRQRTGSASREGRGKPPNQPDEGLLLVASYSQVREMLTALGLFYSAAVHSADPTPFGPHRPGSTGGGPAGQKFWKTWDEEAEERLADKLWAEMNPMGFPFVEYHAFERVIVEIFMGTSKFTQAPEERRRQPPPPGLSATTVAAIHTNSAPTLSIGGEGGGVVSGRRTDAGVTAVTSLDDSLHKRFLAQQEERDRRAEEEAAREDAYQAGKEAVAAEVERMRNFLHSGSNTFQTTMTTASHQTSLHSHAEYPSSSPRETNVPPPRSHSSPNTSSPFRHKDSQMSTPPPSGPHDQFSMTTPEAEEPLYHPSWIPAEVHEGAVTSTVHLQSQKHLSLSPRRGSPTRVDRVSQATTTLTATPAGASPTGGERVEYTLSQQFKTPTGLQDRETGLAWESVVEKESLREQSGFQSRLTEAEWNKLDPDPSECLDPIARSYQLHNDHIQAGERRVAALREKQERECTFRPELGEVSKLLDASKREKESSEPRYKELVEKERVRQELLIDSQRKARQQEMQECTFKPNVERARSSLPGSLSPRVASPKSLSPHSARSPQAHSNPAPLPPPLGSVDAGMEGRLEERMQRTQHDVSSATASSSIQRRERALQKLREDRAREFEREEMECTFKPETHPYVHMECQTRPETLKPLGKNGNSCSYAGMAKAAKKGALHMGAQHHRALATPPRTPQRTLDEEPPLTVPVPFNLSSETKSDRRSSQGPVILKLDINLGSGIGNSTLTVHENDDPKVVARNFALKYGLLKKRQKQLQALIQRSIEASLSPTAARSVRDQTRAEERERERELAQSSYAPPAMESEHDRVESAGVSSIPLATGSSGGGTELRELGPAGSSASEGEGSPKERTGSEGEGGATSDSGGSGGQGEGEAGGPDPTLEPGRPETPQSDPYPGSPGAQMSSPECDALSPIPSQGADGEAKAEEPSSSPTQGLSPNSPLAMRPPLSPGGPSMSPPARRSPSVGGGSSYDVTDGTTPTLTDLSGSPSPNKRPESKKGSPGSGRSSGKGKGKGKAARVSDGSSVDLSSDIPSLSSDDLP